jgi:hypothetical protein
MNEVNEMNQIDTKGNNMTETTMMPVGTTAAETATSGVQQSDVQQTNSQQIQQLAEQEGESAVELAAVAGAASASSAYVPAFSPKVRTIVYIAGLLASVVGLGFLTFGDASVAAFISTAAGLVASGFGVAYNPVRAFCKESY